MQFQSAGKRSRTTSPATQRPKCPRVDVMEPCKDCRPVATVHPERRPIAAAFRGAATCPPLASLRRLMRTSAQDDCAALWWLYYLLQRHHFRVQASPSPLQ
ncbi:hypothetical protein V5799_011844 [Amblyomma americanum]|uniref:Uncharacterized protein n=1 Tax=Amblyomma americanum TaxID=6943 RepID=A0AAQ4EFM5_AMBAM